MPEGPECRILAEQLSARVLGLCLDSIDFTRPRSNCLKTFNARPQSYKESMMNNVIGKSVRSVRSHGKLIFVELDGPYYLLFSLGMTGNFTEKPGSQYEVLSASFTNSESPTGHTVIYFTDIRTFGSFDIVDHPRFERKLMHLGVDLFLLSDEALGEFVSRVRHRLALSKSRLNICKFLMDQSYVAGIGNYIKSEALYRAGISPDAIIQSLSDSSLINLLSSARTVAEASYKAGGLTSRDYLHMDGGVGMFSPHLQVYNKREDPNGLPVTRIITPDRRATWYVKSVQKTQV